MEYIGLRIKALRKKKDLTQEKLAEYLGVSFQAVSKWETGKAMPDYSVIEPLCQALHISVAELLTGREKATDANGETRSDDLILLTYKVEQLEKSESSRKNSGKTVTTGAGISFGSALAIVISYVHWHSIGWAIFHGILGWIYVIYYALKY